MPSLHDDTVQYRPNTSLCRINLACHSRLQTCHPNQIPKKKVVSPIDNLGPFDVFLVFFFHLKGRRFSFLRSLPSSPPPF